MRRLVILSRKYILACFVSVMMFEVKCCFKIRAKLFRYNAKFVVLDRQQRIWQASGIEMAYHSSTMKSRINEKRKSCSILPKHLSSHTTPLETVLSSWYNFLHQSFQSTSRPRPSPHYSVPTHTPPMTPNPSIQHIQIYRSTYT
jgi:hypothetical protein